MANINDFKNVNIRSKKYSKYLNLTDEQERVNGARFGFYLLALECITNTKDIDELIEMIIDTDFRSVMYRQRNNDLGIDAVNINNDEQVIQLFNFKFREKFRADKGQELGDMVDGIKFLLPIDNERMDELTELTKEKISSIIDLLNSDDVWKIELYMVSNDNKSLMLTDPTVNQFKENYGMEVNTVILDDIVSYISELPDDLNAKFVVDSTSVMTYEVDNLSTSKSYLIRLSLAELIRITCSDGELRDTTTENYLKLKDQDLEMSLLFDNVRGYLGEKTKFNKNIIKTIKDSPNNFFMFNNGLTMTAKNIKAGYQNGRKKFECEINGFQIVNGGQTLRSVYEFSKNSFDEENLANAEILIRLFQTEADKGLTNDIAEYTNSQNAISSIDLKSISNFQIQLESFLKSHDILYVRKSGHVGEVETDYRYRISMEKVAQIIYTNMGYPDRATNQKKALFEKYYDEIFNEDKLDFELVVNLIEKYFLIDQEYSKSNYKNFHQKYLYILYIMKKLEVKLDTELEYIDLLERYITEYKKDENISDARKLIQKGFKDYVESRVMLHSTKI
ncbi:AIPR family protein [Listeria booriae]|uniref:AIPR family protein n=1 Tax=Listeria booriae TaxID=1552123 RepID=UPI001628973F|nr:AIPR family protein [Listeria booriae]MBC1914257.1 AIPR family protein [Listeria booriae]